MTLLSTISIINIKCSEVEILGIRDLEKNTNTLSSEKLQLKENSALKRLSKRLDNQKSIIDITNYSRMHNRHNRS